MTTDECIQDASFTDCESSHVSKLYQAFVWRQKAVDQGLNLAHRLQFPPPPLH